MLSNARLKSNCTKFFTYELSLVSKLGGNKRSAFTKQSNRVNNRIPSLAKIEIVIYIGYKYFLSEIPSQVKKKSAANHSHIVLLNESPRDEYPSINMF